MTAGKYITWDRDLLENLYLKQRLTAKAIAVRLGCSEGAVRIAFRKFGLTRTKRTT